MSTRTQSESGSPLNTVPTPNYSRVSSFRSSEVEVLLYSPQVRTESTSWASSRTIPVYGVHDAVGGKIIIAPSCQSGRIVLNISGTLVSNRAKRDSGKFLDDGAGKQRHVFLFVSQIIHVTSDSNTSRKGLREVFKGRSRPTTFYESETRTFPFTFDLGCSQQPGEILPTTIIPSDSKSSAVEVSYQITATWEPLKLTEQSSSLTIPIIVQPDPDFHSLDGDQISWIEIPLKSHRPVPVRCAVTLPSALTFSRASSIPFFVVFTTTPHSAVLAREIAGDATISVSVSSEISVMESSIPNTTRTMTESLRSDRSSESRFKAKVLKRLKSKTSLLSLQSSESLPSKPLPPVSPQNIFLDTRTVYNGISIGFPKRPRHASSSQKAHPTLEELRSLPDGLYKDKIPLSREILTSFNWVESL
ncbi:hypothetical protein B0H19DRAFT_1383753 [Mycena capillaripes]|nr:hypothetical protein B0H19DRAFT_1272496 [Mycena capillaripes]KAJ6533107.1 hypothetical protein B0H19DRAFT_1383753 [Mycena capillaripes]